MKAILILLLILLALQSPLAWDAYEKSRQCDSSLAKELSGSLAKAHPDLDVVDCSFAHFYGAALKSALQLN